MTRREARARLWHDVKPLVQLLAPLCLLLVVLAINVSFAHQPPDDVDVYVAPTVTTTPMVTSPTSTAASKQAPSTTTVRPAATARAVDWDWLADCESGAWDEHGVPIRGTANWADRIGVYEGGVHFASSTWDGARPDGFPDAAYLASREQQITVAEIVLDEQGPGAWPTCSWKVGMR